MAYSVLYITARSPESARRALSLAGLTSEAAAILRDAADLPQPASVSVDDSQRIDLVFDPDPASYPVLA